MLKKLGTFLASPFVYVKNKVVGWWSYSRIIFLNVAAALVAAGPDIIGYMVGLDYDALFQHEIAVMVGLAVNIASIALRLNTYTPVGATPEQKAVAVEASLPPISEVPSPKAV